MSENQKEPQYKLRWSEELRDKVVESAKSHSRSINAEICTRLEQSFEPEVKVSETLEFELMMQSYLEQAKQIKELKEMLEQVLKKPT
ncbi:Arc family DNA-binding protein [Acinetobacter sp. UNC436CL71CviS28]|uniref:Arc family DNA-binding protein n=1 Tax=Acinetobacter sp. UNC436CL71CviS28 TaxID=1380368 RepID=UPI000479D379|nr:Arc family DNA-binding protein [Acinetobacter sp. UNC436CL71CviS28]